MVGWPDGRIATIDHPPIRRSAHPTRGVRGYFRCHHSRRRPRRLYLRDSERPTRPQHGRRGTGETGRGVRQHWLHPDQSPAAFRVHRRPAEGIEGLRRRSEQRQNRLRRGDETLAPRERSELERRRVPDEEAQDHRHQRHGRAAAREEGEGRQRRARGKKGRRHRHRLSRERHSADRPGNQQDDGETSSRRSG